MKKTTLLILLLFSFQAHSQNIRLNYQPHGRIIKFCTGGLTVITDSRSALSQLYKIKNKRKVTNPDEKIYSNEEFERIKNLLSSKPNHAKDDTLKLSGGYAFFGDGISKPNQKKVWYTDYLVWRVIEKNKALLYDKQGKRVKRISTKKRNQMGRGKQTGELLSVVKDYINVETNEVLFTKLIKWNSADLYSTW
jgi:hypothetical protein